LTALKPPALAEAFATDTTEPEQIYSRRDKKRKHQQDTNEQPDSTEPTQLESEDMNHEA